MYEESIAGYPIGLNSVQDIMQNVTQSNLSFFHSAGTSSSTILTLSPSIPQILDVSNSMTCRMVVDGRPKSLEYCCLKDLITGIAVIDSDESDWIQLGVRLKYFEVPKEYRHILQISFDPRKLIHHEISLSEIHIPRYRLVFSPNIIGLLNIYVNNRKEVLPLINTIDRITFGLEGVCRSVAIADKTVTAGSNLSGLLRVPGVNFLTSTSNHIPQIFELLGIEAARKVIFQELMQKNSSKMSAGLFADLMTRDGIVQPFLKSKRFSQHKGLLLSMGMERPSTDLMEMYNTVHDRLTNSYAKIAMGYIPDSSDDRISRENILRAMDDF